MLEYRKIFYKHYASTKSVTEDKAHIMSGKEFLMYVIKHYFPTQQQSKIVELGCGSGTLLYCAKNMGYQDLIGFDISEEQIQIAHARGLNQIYSNDAFSAIKTFPHDSVDVIVSFDIIEHMTKNEAIAFSQGVYQILKRGGRWIIHTINAESPFFGRIRYGDFTHENAFTKSSIQQLLTVSGFQKISCHEDCPVIHGLKSMIRFILWKILRTIYRFCLAIETGEKNGIFSQNFVVLAEKE